MKSHHQKKVANITGNYSDWLRDTLQDKEAAFAHIQVALDLYQHDQNKKALLLALKDVADAQGGIGWLAKQTQLNREHLYYLLSGKGNPRFDTVNLILNAFGFHLKLGIIPKTLQNQVF